MLFDPALVGYGAIVGLSLGLTGSGGSILAIPLLVYGVHMPMQQALAVSLLMVASIAAFGALRQHLSGQVKWRAAVLFSLSGIVISPIVVAYTHDINETLRLVMFAVLMLVVALRMALPRSRKQEGGIAQLPHHAGFVQVMLGGALAGALSGFFGVGGGFVIVPLLTLIFMMPYKQAVGTSLASIALISSSALAGYFMKGSVMDWPMVLLFVLGGAVGLVAGIMAMNRIPEMTARRVFSVITAALAIFMLVDKLYLQQGGSL